MKKLISKIKY